jgi:hypothetical protein
VTGLLEDGGWRVEDQGRRWKSSICITTLVQGAGQTGYKAAVGVGTASGCEKPDGGKLEFPAFYSEGTHRRARRARVGR